MQGRKEVHKSKANNRRREAAEKKMKAKQLNLRRKLDNHREDRAKTKHYIKQQ